MYNADAEAEINARDVRSSSSAKVSSTLTRRIQPTSDAACASTTATTTITSCKEILGCMSQKKRPLSSPHIEAHDGVFSVESSTSPKNSPTPSGFVENMSHLEELILTQLSTRPKSPEEFISSSNSSLFGLTPSPPLSPELCLNWSESDLLREPTALDKKIVNWVTQTDPIIEQWEIYYRIQEYSGYLYHSLSVMQRLHELYLGQTEAGVLLEKCQIYDRSRRIRDRFTTLDKLPDVEDAHFYVDTANICVEHCLVNRDCDRALAWIEPVKGTPKSRVFKPLPRGIVNN